MSLLLDSLRRPREQHSSTGHADRTARADAVLTTLGYRKKRGPGLPRLIALGAIGVAVTPLRPAGIARIGDDFVDVVAEGSYVPEGNRVQVIEIEGHRVVVKEV